MLIIDCRVLVLSTNMLTMTPRLCFTPQEVYPAEEQPLTLQSGVKIHQI